MRNLKKKEEVSKQKSVKKKDEPVGKRKMKHKSSKGDEPNVELES